MFVVSDARPNILKILMIPLAAIAAMSLITIIGWQGSIEPTLLDRIAVFAAGIAMFLLVLLNVVDYDAQKRHNREVMDKLDKLLGNRANSVNDSRLLKDDAGSSDSNEEFVHGQCGKPGCKKTALTGTKACREHLCIRCQTGWNSSVSFRPTFFHRNPRPCVACQWRVKLYIIGGIAIGLYVTLWEVALVYFVSPLG